MKNLFDRVANVFSKIAATPQKPKEEFKCVQFVSSTTESSDLATPNKTIFCAAKKELYDARQKIRQLEEQMAKNHHRYMVDVRKRHEATIAMEKAFKLQIKTLQDSLATLTETKAVLKALPEESQERTTS